MKSGSSILDADMATVFGWFRAGFEWWREELEGLVPAKLRRRTDRPASYVYYRGNGDWELHGKPGACTVLLAPEVCLTRRLDLPQLRASDLASLVSLEADRLFPLPASLIAVAARQERGRESETLVGAVSLESGRRIVDELAAAGVTASKIALADADQSPDARSRRIALDFTPSLSASGVLAVRSDRAARWWLLMGFLFILNLGLLIWRDMHAVHRLEEVVAAQAPAVSAARNIAGRIGRGQNLALQLADMRARGDALGALAETTRVLPAQSWVQRYEWSPDGVRISGYRREGADVAAAMRKSAYFRDVRNSGSDTSAELPTGLPFDLTARIAGGRP